MNNMRGGGGGEYVEMVRAKGEKPSPEYKPPT